MSDTDTYHIGCSVQNPSIRIPLFSNSNHKISEIKNKTKITIRKKWFPKIKRSIMDARHEGVKKMGIQPPTML